MSMKLALTVTPVEAERWSALQEALLIWEKAFLGE